jgi:tetratricopeptide (TPR) repeat protein
MISMKIFFRRIGILSGLFGLAFFAASNVMAGAHGLSTYKKISAYLHIDQFDRALVYVESSLKKNPSDPQLLLFKASILEKLGKTDEAISIYQLMASNTPEIAQSYNNLAVIYAGQGHLYQAEKELKAAILINPNFIDAQENLAKIYMQLNIDALQKLKKITR